MPSTSVILLVMVRSGPGSCIVVLLFFVTPLPLLPYVGGMNGFPVLTRRVHVGSGLLGGGGPCRQHCHEECTDIKITSPTVYADTCKVVGADAVPSANHDVAEVTDADDGSGQLTGVLMWSAVEGAASTRGFSRNNTEFFNS